MALPKVTSNNETPNGHDFGLEAPFRTHYRYSVTDTQPSNMETGAFLLSDSVPLDLESFWTTTESGQPFSEQVPLDFESPLGSINQDHKDRAPQLPSGLEDSFLTAHPSSILNPPASELNAEPFPFISGLVPLDFNSVWGHGNSSRTDTASLPSSLSVSKHGSTLLLPNAGQTNATPQPPSSSNPLSSRSGDTPQLHSFSRPKATNIPGALEAELIDNALQVPVSLPLKFLQDAKSKSDREYATIDITFKITCV
jgi:hypothetical protein